MPRPRDLRTVDGHHEPSVKLFQLAREALRTLHEDKTEEIVHEFPEASFSGDFFFQEENLA